MCPAVANKSAKKTIVLSFILMWNHLLISMPISKRYKTNSDFLRNPLQVFYEVQLSAFLHQNIFRRCFLPRVWFCCPFPMAFITQNLAFLKAGSYPVLSLFHCTSTTMIKMQMSSYIGNIITMKTVFS
jgi:hypothetical protein